MECMLGLGAHSDVQVTIVLCVVLRPLQATNIASRSVATDARLKAGSRAVDTSLVYAIRAGLLRMYIDMARLEGVANPVEAGRNLFAASWADAHWRTGAVCAVGSTAGAWNGHRLVRVARRCPRPTFDEWV
jgi:hypothetical protein